MATSHKTEQIDAGGADGVKAIGAVAKKHQKKMNTSDAQDNWLRWASNAKGGGGKKRLRGATQSGIYKKKRHAPAFPKIGGVADAPDGRTHSDVNGALLAMAQANRKIKDKAGKKEAAALAAAPAASATPAPAADTTEAPRVWLEIDIGGEPVGRIEIELFADVVPRTCENFRALCTGERGASATSGAMLHFKGSAFHRVVTGFMCQGGDFTCGDGTGGESIYGAPFADEDLTHRAHDAPFLLSMANSGADTNGSQFFITTAAAPHLDGKHVVFGAVSSGQMAVRRIEMEGSADGATMESAVRIADCGQVGGARAITLPAAASDGGVAGDGASAVLPAASEDEKAAASAAEARASALETVSSRLLAPRARCVDLI